MRTIQISSFKSFNLSIKTSQVPNEWILSFLARSDKMMFSPTSPRDRSETKVNGFYLIKTEKAYITFENENSSWRREIDATINKVWHSGESPSIKLESKISPITLQEIHKNTGGKDIKISWHVIGYGFLDDKDPHYSDRLCVIDASSSTGITYSNQKFLSDILEKVDRFRREFIEIKIPTKESISSTSEEFKPLAKLLMERYVLLEDSLKKMYDATSSREYAGSINDVRTALGSMEHKISQLKNIIAEKLFLDVGTFTGDGAIDQSIATTSCIQSIIGRLYSLASGMGIHWETNEENPKSYVPHPDQHDARYILLTSILTLDYLSQKLQNYNIRQEI